MVLWTPLINNVIVHMLQLKKVNKRFYNQYCYDRWKNSSHKTLFPAIIASNRGGNERDFCLVRLSRYNIQGVTGKTANMSRDYMIMLGFIM